MEICYHCGQPIPAAVDLKVVIDAEPRSMCCVGCLAISQAIVGAGLERFYTHRTAPNRDGRSHAEAISAELEIYDHEAVQRGFVSRRGDHGREASLIVEGIVCAACVWLIERHLAALPGVVGAQINYSSHRARVEWDNREISLSAILRSIAAIGYRAHPFDPGRLESLQKRERARALRRLAVAGVGAMQVMMLAVGLYAGDYYGMDSESRTLLRWASLLIALPVTVYAGGDFLRGAWNDLRRRRLGMDVPVSLAISLALVASGIATWTGRGPVYFDSVTMFTFFLITGRFLEMNARHRAGEATEALAKLLPTMALRIGSDQQQAVPVSELRRGDRVRVRPGERVPADAMVLEGSSSLDESLLSGESVPVLRGPGARLIGGSLNIDGTLLARVLAVGDDTLLSSVLRLLDRAQSEKPEVAALADRVAGWFVLGVLSLAGAVALYWGHREPGEVVRITIAVLVVSCPCALSLATPVGLTAATGNLTRRGLLAVRGHALETLARVTHVVFDKTGTLTTGNLQVRRLEERGRLSCSQCLQIAAALEAGSEHPVGRALRESCKPLARARDLRNSPGEGVEGWVDGCRYRLGSAAFVAAISDTGQTPDTGPESTVYLADQGGILAVVLLSDRLRPDARQAVSQLHRLDLQTVLLSGDGGRATAAVAKEAGVCEAEGGLLPSDKLRRMRTLQARGAVVVAVGDGVNDAPVLGGAEVSIAMGGGTQLAQASADMILLSERLTVLPEAVELARRTLLVIRQNLSWAIGYNALALPLAAAGWVQPWMAAIGMSASSLLVVLNALRLRGGGDRPSQTVCLADEHRVERALP